jgi:hypothetical protein
VMGQDHDSIQAGIEQLGQTYVSAGRDPSMLRVRIPLPLIRVDGRLSLDATLDAAPEAAGPGITDATIPVAAFVRGPGDIEPFFDAICRYTEGRPS